MGAYLSTAAPGIPTILHGLMLSGAYNVPAIKEDVYGVYTNTTPVEAYRGAGRPEATFMLERMIDKLADELKIDPAEVRRRNLHPALRERLQRGDRPHLRQRQLSGRAREGARPRRIRRPARGAGRAPQAAERPVSRHRRLHLRRDLRPRAVAGRRRHRLPGRSVGERDRPLPSDRQGERLHRRLAARSGRRDDVRADRRERARRRCQRREGHPRRHRHHADGLGHLRQPHDGGRRRRAGDWRRARSRRRPSCSRRTCSRRRRRTSTTTTASSS